MQKTMWVMEDYPWPTLYLIMASLIYEFSYKLIMYFGFYKITSAPVKLDQRLSCGTLFQPKNWQ